MTLSLRRLTATGLLAAAAVAADATAAHAATAATAAATATATAARQAEFAVEPLRGASAKGWFIFKGAPGDRLAGTVRIVNRGAIAGTVRVDAVDGATGRTSGAVYVDRAIGKRDVARWTRLARHTLHLAPGEAQVVSFTVRVPDRVRAGQHLGGIVAEQGNTGSAGGKGRFRVRVRRQTIIALQVDLPGAERAAIQPTGVKAGAQTGFPSVLLGLTAPGTKFQKGHGTLVLETAAGTPVARTAFRIDTMLAGAHIDFPVTLKEPLDTGDYRATVTVRSAGKRVAREFSFTVADTSGGTQRFGGAVARRIADAGQNPAAVLGGAALLILASFGGGLVFARRRLRRDRAAAAAALVADAGWHAVPAAPGPEPVAIAALVAERTPEPHAEPPAAFPADGVGPTSEDPGFVVVVEQPTLAITAIAASLPEARHIAAVAASLPEVRHHAAAARH